MQKKWVVHAMCKEKGQGEEFRKRTAAVRMQEAALKREHLRVWTSLVAQTVRCLTTMQETRVQSLGWEDLLEKEMATHPGTLAWKIPWTEEPGRLQFMGSQIVGHD